MMRVRVEEGIDGKQGNHVMRACRAAAAQKKVVEEVFREGSAKVPEKVLEASVHSFFFLFFGCCAARPRLLRPAGRLTTQTGLEPGGRSGHGWARGWARARVQGKSSGERVFTLTVCACWCCAVVLLPVSVCCRHCSCSSGGGGRWAWCGCSPCGSARLHPGRRAPWPVRLRHPCALHSACLESCPREPDLHSMAIAKANVPAALGVHVVPSQQWPGAEWSSGVVCGGG